MNIKIDLKIFAFLLIYIFTKQISIYAVLLFFAFLHEMAHCLAGRLVGFYPGAIQITPLGFCLSFQTKCEDYNTPIKKANQLALKKMIIAMAGPALNLVLGLLLLIYQIVSKQETILTINIRILIYSNFLLFIWNMLPIYPLDGGRILKETIYMKKGLRQSYLISQQISKISIIILTAAVSVFILFYHNIAVIIMLIYLWILVHQNQKKIRLIQEMDRNIKESV